MSVVINGVRRSGGQGLRSALTVLCVVIGLGALPGFATTFEDFNRAVAMNDARTVAELLRRGVDPQTVNERGEVALLAAAREGSIEVVRALLKGRAKVNQRNAHGDSAIMMAALNGHLAVVKVLRDAGAAINHPGWTPLLYAAINGHDAIVEYLLSSGA
ncbi:MAG: ankyrin repeat domain-containing protein, partial [Betaproteobacteria bacterium]